ncbi:MAG: AAA family ATPase [Deltaproteobacteria bacterium]|nr:AAA family ATPase [Deltaproteobacteria bacterium]
MHENGTSISYAHPDQLSRADLEARREDVLSKKTVAERALLRFARKEDAVADDGTHAFRRDLSESEQELAEIHEALSALDVSEGLAEFHEDAGTERLAPAEATPTLKPASSRVTLRHPAELSAAPVSYRIENILLDAMLTVLHAVDKVGKTLLAWEMARAVLLRTLFLNTFATTHGRVVLALLDDPHGLTVQRRDLLGLGDCSDLRIVTPLDADMSDPVAFLSDFRRACEAFKPGLIVLDALYQFAPPGKDSMNDASRMRGIMAEFNRLAETLPAAVVLIAHDKKDGSDVAGSHVIRATAKALLHLAKPKWTKDEEEEDDGRRILTVVSKLTGEARHLLRNQGAGAWMYLGRGDSAQQSRTTWARDRVLTCLRDGSGTSQDIGKRARIRKEDALTVLTELIEEGSAESELIPRTDGKKGKGRLVYRLKANVLTNGTISPKEQNGNNRSETLEPAKINAQVRLPIVPPLILAAGTIGLEENPLKNEDSERNLTYCSRNPLPGEELDFEELD